MPDRKPILCLDFDGVIHSYTSGWQGADVIPDPPVEGAIAFMLGALREFDVVIFSSRSHQPRGALAMRDWLYKHANGVWWETPDGPGLEDVRFVKEKPAAMVTLDDRAITFEGTWPDIETLKAFKPWNKRPPETPAPPPPYNFELHPGLPPDGEEGPLLGFDAKGVPYVLRYLRWRDAEPSPRWYAVGWEQYDFPRPVVHSMPAEGELPVIVAWARAPSITWEWRALPEEQSHG